MKEELKEYKAIIWGPEPDSIGERHTILAKDLKEAREKLRRLKEEYGPGATSTLDPGEDDPRLKRNR